MVRRTGRVQTFRGGRTVARTGANQGAPALRQQGLNYNGISIAAAFTGSAAHLPQWLPGSLTGPP